MASKSLLAGTRVVEVANVITGPLAGMLLADLGADVIKVEAVHGGDPFRAWDASGGDLRPSFAAFNRGKRSVAIDLKSDAGRDMVRNLVRTADVVIENFRPGAMARLGLGFDALCVVKPDIVYCDISGQGSSGPHRNDPTYDAVAQALSGLWSQFTHLDDPEPTGPPMSDQLTGIFASLAILAGLRNRDQTGEAVKVEVDMLSSSLAFSGMAVADLSWSGVVADRSSRARTSQTYAFTDSQGAPFAIHLSSPTKFWTGLCQTVGRNELIDDERFHTKALRIKHYDALHEILAAEFSKSPRLLWLGLLGKADVPAAPILTIAEAANHPQVIENGLIAEGSPEDGGGLVRSPIAVAGTHLVSERSAPRLGEHTSEVLAELGITEEGMRQLVETGAIVLAESRAS